jgi:hypothetical protein
LINGILQGIFGLISYCRRKQTIEFEGANVLSEHHPGDVISSYLKAMFKISKPWDTQETSGQPWDWNDWISMDEKKLD